MSSNIIYSDHITDFQHVLYFLTENNMSTSEIAHVNLDECHLKIKTKEIYNNFNVKLSKDLYQTIHWCEIDYLNQNVLTSNQIQILDVVQRPTDEFKTVYYIVKNEDTNHEY